MRAVFLLCLVGCSSGSLSDADLSRPLSPDSTEVRPPPAGDLDLAVIGGVVGQEMYFEVTGANPFEEVTVVRTAAGPGSTCFGALEGHCFDLAAPVKHHKTMFTTSGGDAAAFSLVPDLEVLVGSDACFQAAARHGPGDIEISPAVCVPIGPDSDGDTVPDHADVCDGGDDTVHNDEDGVPDDCDACPYDTADDFDEDGSCDSDDPCPEDPFDLCPPIWEGMGHVGVSGDAKANASCPAGTEVAFGFVYQMSSDFGGAGCLEDNIKSCGTGGSTCATPSCDTPGNDESFAYAACTPTPERFDSMEVVSARGGEEGVMATCPPGKVIGWGWKLHLSDEHASDACMKANNGPCLVGDASCSTDPCDTPGQDEVMVQIGCMPPGLIDLSSVNAVGNDGDISATCPVGETITFGWAIQHNEEGGTPACLKPNNTKCPIGDPACATGVCDSSGDDEAQINVFCR
jgi:hypothetical protein